MTLYWGSGVAWGARTSKCPCYCLSRCSGSLSGVRVGWTGEWAGAGLGGLPTPLLVLGEEIMHRTLLLLLASQNQLLGFDLFVSYYS